MPTLLQINSSIHSDKGQSSRLAATFVEQWRQANPDGNVIVRDLAANPLPHLTAERFQAFTTQPDQRTDEQVAHAQVSDDLIQELKTAEVIVMGLPMYNFGIPSNLKAWIDHVARAGETFKYTENGPVGLLGDRKVLLFAARGGQYLGTPQDSQTTYMTTFLNFIGLKDIEFVYAEGLAMGGDASEQALKSAQAKIEASINTLKPVAA